VDPRLVEERCVEELPRGQLEAGEDGREVDRFVAARGAHRAVGVDHDDRTQVL